MSASFSFNKDYVTNLELFDIIIKHDNGIITISDIQIDQNKLSKNILADTGEILNASIHNGELRIITNCVSNNSKLVETVTYLKDPDSIQNFLDFLNTIHK